MENTIETKVCKWTGKEFPIYEADKMMLEKLSPTIGGKVYHLPLPDLSPKAREINRLMFRNERKFYHIPLKNGKQEISTIHPELRSNIIAPHEGDTYDYTQNGIAYSGDIEKDMQQLFYTVPGSARLVVDMENSPYCNQEAGDKNCHLNAGGHDNEDCMYNTFSIHAKDSLDNYWIFKSENIYESLDIFESSKIFFSGQIKGGYNIYFWYDLIGCQNVLFWNNLENQSYVYKNEVLSKEVWQETYSKFKQQLQSYEGLQQLKKEFELFLQTSGKKEVFIEGSENSYGNIITNSKDSFSVLYGQENQNIRYGNILWEATDSMDINSFACGSKLYDIASSYQVTHSTNSGLVLESSNCHYCLSVSNIHFAFASYGFGLKNKSHLILNTVYPKDEWELQVQKIIEELQQKWKWGRFLSPDLSPYPYNDSTAMEYHPIQKAVYMDGGTMLKEETIRENGNGTVYILEPEKFISKAIIDFGGEEKVKTHWRTKETEINIPKNAQTISWNEIPEISETTDDILAQVIICERSGRPFRITKKELEFYKKHGLPIPRLHYDERHFNRIQKKTTKIFEQK